MDGHRKIQKNVDLDHILEEHFPIKSPFGVTSPDITRCPAWIFCNMSRGLTGNLLSQDSESIVPKFVKMLKGGKVCNRISPIFLAVHAKTSKASPVQPTTCWAMENKILKAGTSASNSSPMVFATHLKTFAAFPSSKQPATCFPTSIIAVKGSGKFTLVLPKFISKRVKVWPTNVTRHRCLPQSTEMPSLSTEIEGPFQLGQLALKSKSLVKIAMACSTVSITVLATNSALSAAAL